MFDQLPVAQSRLIIGISLREWKLVRQNILSYGDLE